MKITTIYHRMRRLNQQMVKNYRRGIGPHRLVLLLTTTGRRSGLPRTTPLQYEEMDGLFYVASARGAQADWFQNLLAHPHVCVQVGARQLDATAEAVTDPGRIADFLVLRRRRRPVMIRLIMIFEGVAPWAGRARLEEFAQGKAMVVLRPE